MHKLYVFQYIGGPNENSLLIRIRKKRENYKWMKFDWLIELKLDLKADFKDEMFDFNFELVSSYLV